MNHSESFSTSPFESDSDDVEHEIIFKTNSMEILDEDTDEMIGKSSISKIRECYSDCSEATTEENYMHKSESFHSSELMDKESEIFADDFFMNPDFNFRHHIFILSTAGKPIYSLNYAEDKLATLFGLLQALVSVVQTNEDDSIKSIQANGLKFVFLEKDPLILVAITKIPRSTNQILSQLLDVYNQIISIVTLSHLKHIYEKRRNYDLRKLLAGSERLIDHLLINDKNKKVSNNPFSFLTHSIRILPLDLSIRDLITNAIQSSCSKIKNLVFAILISNNKLITLVRMKNYYIHADDLRLLLNLVECTESFKSAESWTPICLPKFDPNGFLHAHVSYISDDCEACLLLLSTDSDQFFALSEAKKKITDKMRRSNCLEPINEAMKNKGINLKLAGINDMRHFLYKSKKNGQLLCSEITVPYNKLDEFERLENLYYNIHHRIHNTSRPLKLIYETYETESLIAWSTATYELYATFEPIMDREKSNIISQVNKLLKAIKNDEEKFFMMKSYTF